jgi:hypothetical protein
MNVHWKKSTNENEGKPEQKFYAAFGISFRISKRFRRRKLNLIIIFLYKNSGYPFKIICPFTDSADIIL